MAKLEIDLKQVEKLAGKGLTLDEIALAIGISIRTLHRRKSQMAEVALAIKKGRVKSREDVANALYEECMKGNLGAIIWFEKTRFGISDKVNSDSELTITIKREGEKPNANDLDLTEPPPIPELGEE